MTECPNGGRCIELAGEVAALRAKLTTADRTNRDQRTECEQTIAALRDELAATQGMVVARSADVKAMADYAKSVEAERDRLISANDTLVERIEDLTEGYALEDTCPRVQCRTTSKRLKAQADEIHAAYESLAETQDELVAEVERMSPVVDKLETALRKYANFQRGAFRDGAPDYVRDALAAVDAIHPAQPIPDGAVRITDKAAPEGWRWAATSATQDANADSDRETGHNASG